jgi:hypothetical protein
MMRKAPVHNLLHLLSSFVSLHACSSSSSSSSFAVFAATENHHLLSLFFLLGWGRYLLLFEQKSFVICFCRVVVVSPSLLASSFLLASFKKKFVGTSENQPNHSFR